MWTRPVWLSSLAAVANALPELGQFLAMLIWLIAGVLWSHHAGCPPGVKFTTAKRSRGLGGCPAVSAALALHLLLPFPSAQIDYVEK